MSSNLGSSHRILDVQICSKRLRPLTTKATSHTQQLNQTSASRRLQRKIIPRVNDMIRKAASYNEREKKPQRDEWDCKSRTRIFFPPPLPPPLAPFFFIILARRGSFYEGILIFLPPAQVAPSKGLLLAWAFKCYLLLATMLPRVPVVFFFFFSERCVWIKYVHTGGVHGEFYSPQRHVMRGGRGDDSRFIEGGLTVNARVPSDRWVKFLWSQWSGEEGENWFCVSRDALVSRAPAFGIIKFAFNALFISAVWL